MKKILDNVKRFRNHGASFTSLDYTMKHSSIVGGSTAKRVINCPGSVELCKQIPPKPSSTFADTGTLCHNVIANILEVSNNRGHSLVGVMSYAGITLTQELLEDKVHVALDLLDQVDPDQTMEYDQERVVSFGKFLPGAFGSVDLIGRIGDTAVVLDWKFGDGVAVEAEENEQLLYYTAAAMRTPETAWVFDGAKDLELIIIQPPHIRRWKTTLPRVTAFANTLKKAVKLAQAPGAPVKAGDHCRWCAAKPICPLMTGAVDRALQVQLKDLPAESIGAYMKNAELLDGWLTDLRALALQMMENGVTVPGWKLVQKRGTRKWLDEDTAKQSLTALGLTEPDLMDVSFKSPAQVEKVLKKAKIDLPGDLVQSVSSGNTYAPESDPRPSVQLLGAQLSAAFSKLS